MVKDIKGILAKLKIAQKNNKKEVQVLKKKTSLLLLNLLWKEGFIYGYCTLNSFFYNVFIKYSTKGFSVFKNTVFLNKSISYRKLHSANRLEKNCNYLILNSNGFFLDKKCLKKGLGGLLFVKI